MKAKKNVGISWQFVQVMETLGAWKLCTHEEKHEELAHCPNHGHLGLGNYYS
jgi:hypothetical protein